MVKVQMASTYCASAAGGLYNCRKNIYKTVFIYTKNLLKTSLRIW